MNTTPLGKMKVFEVHFKRIEYCKFSIEADSKKDVKKIIENAEWDLDTEKAYEMENKSFKITEVKQ